MEAAASPSSPPQVSGTAAFRVLENTAYLPLGLALHPGSLLAMKGFSTSPGGFRHGTLQKMGPVTPGGGLMLLPGFVQHPAQLSWGLGDTSEHQPLTVALLWGSQHAPGIPITAPLAVFCRGGGWQGLPGAGQGDVQGCRSLISSTGCSHASTSAIVPALAPARARRWAESHCRCSAFEERG